MSRPPAALPRVDHLVVNAGFELDSVARAWEHLGFHLTDRGHHSLGSINHLIVFADDYLELLGLPPGQDPPSRPELANGIPGFHACALAMDDAQATRRGLLARGIDAGAVTEFERPVRVLVDAEPVERSARFRVIRSPPPEFAGARIFHCQHLTPEWVWRDEWRGHPNGATAIGSVEIASIDPDRTARDWQRFLGIGSSGGSDPIRLSLGDAVIAIHRVRNLVDRLGDAAPPARGRPAFVAALTVVVDQAERTRAWLADRSIPARELDDGRVLVGAHLAGGVAVGFQSGRHR